MAAYVFTYRLDWLAIQCKNIYMNTCTVYVYIWCAAGSLAMSIACMYWIVYQLRFVNERIPKILPLLTAVLMLWQIVCSLARLARANSTSEERAKHSSIAVRIVCIAHHPHQFRSTHSLCAVPQSSHINR